MAAIIRPRTLQSVRGQAPRGKGAVNVDYGRDHASHHSEGTVMRWHRAPLHNSSGFGVVVRTETEFKTSLAYLIGVVGPTKLAPK
jgi:hypothetical protein